MRPLRLLVALALMLVAGASLAVTRTIRIFEKRQIVIAVPEGWRFDLEKDRKTGVQTVQLDDRDGVKLAASFFPDPGNTLESEEALEARMRELFAPVGEETRFTFTATVDGRAGYAPVGEATKGIRSWPGVFVVFTVTGEERESASYAKAIEVVTAGMREVAR